MPGSVLRAVNTPATLPPRRIVWHSPLVYRCNAHPSIWPKDRGRNGPVSLSSAPFVSQYAVTVLVQNPPGYIAPRPAANRPVGAAQQDPGGEISSFCTSLFVEIAGWASRMDTSGSITLGCCPVRLLDMKTVAIGILSTLGLWAATVAVAAPPTTPAPGKGAGEASLIVMSAPLADGGQQLTVVDPVQRVMCIYHIGAKNGEISLKSVRNITWDLRMTQFNGVNPQPEEIRSLVEQH